MFMCCYYICRVELWYIIAVVIGFVQYMYINIIRRHCLIGCFTVLRAIVVVWASVVRLETVMLINAKFRGNVL